MLLSKAYYLLLGPCIKNAINNILQCQKKLKTALIDNIKNF